MISVVIQGSTTYHDQILKNIPKDFSEFIWSTWEDEPIRNIENIKNSGVSVVINKKPSYNGIANLNLQAISTYNGIRYCKYENILKIRSDILVSDYVSFFKILEKKSKPTFLCWHDHEGGYSVDYFMYANKREMEKYWNYLDNNSQKPPEIQLLENYCILSNINVKESKYKFEYVLYDLKEDLTLNWIKNKITLNSYKMIDKYKVYYDKDNNL